MHRGIGRRIFGAALLSCLSTKVHGGGPYAVDDAAIGNLGECQIESWASFASNGDFIGLAQPACVVSLGIPVEITTAFQASRFAGEWATLTGLQGKFILLPLGSLAVALVINTLFDATNGENVTFVNVPASIKVRDDFRLNLNGGWQRDSIDDTNHFTWGGGFEWDFQRQWTVIAEVYGQTGQLNNPRLQAGVRFAPTKAIDLDIVYGHNITGENANWITAGLTVRFPN